MMTLLASLLRSYSGLAGVFGNSITLLPCEIREYRELAFAVAIVTQALMYYTNAQRYDFLVIISVDFVQC